MGKLLLPLPLTGREIPVVADDWANPEFGTGAVKVTPAHDPNDFAIGQRHGLASITVLDKAAKIDLPPEVLDNDAGSARERYQGSTVLRRASGLSRTLRRLGLLVEVKDHAMTIPVSQRSGSVIEPRLSDQWFVRIQPLADKAIAAVREGHIRFTPEMYEKTYFEWMGNIHDWCISRQLWWGHRIPAWHCVACAQRVRWRGTAPETCAKCGSAELTQETDVLDTWFSAPGCCRLRCSAGQIRRKPVQQIWLSFIRLTPAGDGLRHPVLLGCAHDHAGDALYARRADG